MEIDQQYEPEVKNDVEKPTSAQIPTYSVKELSPEEKLADEMNLFGEALEQEANAVHQNDQIDSSFQNQHKNESSA